MSEKVKINKIPQYE